MSEQSFEAFLADWMANSRNDHGESFDPDDFDTVCQIRADQLSDAAQRAAFRSDLKRMARGYGGNVKGLVRSLLSANATLTPQR